MSVKKKVWEVGSEFHWVGVDAGPFLPWPAPHRLHASGRGALLSIWRALPAGPNSSLHVPEYFCDEVVSWWEERGIMVRRYSDAPVMTAPDWETLTPSPGDAVLAVNYFGMREGNVWQQWRDAHPEVAFIEDHSHDPLSAWATGSTADYAFASLRKTLPVPDGAIMWSPRGLTIPPLPETGDFSASGLKLAAMMLKRDYLQGADQKIKDSFLLFQREGEKMLGAAGDSPVSPWSRLLLAKGCPSSWRSRRKENVATLTGMIGDGLGIHSLVGNHPAASCPFNAVFLFPSRRQRDNCRAALISAGVYPSVHWELRESAPPEMSEISGRIMTIPADQRYGSEDMRAVASIILEGAGSW